MISGETLAAVNASMNATSFACISVAYIAIRNRKIGLHWKSMTAGLIASGLFLAGYLTRMVVYGSKHFEGIGTVRIVYFVILIGHMILAIVIVPLVSRTVYLAVKKRFEVHRPWARVTLPIWAVVSMSGVVVYLMLYHLPT